MPLRSDVESLHAISVAGLASAYDHFYYSQQLWEFLLFDARIPPHGWSQLGLVNGRTGVAVSPHDLRSSVTASFDLYLPSAAVQQLVSVTEAFMGDLVRLWITAYPAHLRGQVDVQAIVAAPDKAAVLLQLTEQYVVAMSYKTPREWFKQLNTIVSLGGPADADVDRFAELNATRDVFVHNRGIVNETYLRKAGGLARGTDGQPIDLPEAYVRDAWVLCQQIVESIGTAAAARA